MPDDSDWFKQNAPLTASPQVQSDADWFRQNSPAGNVNLNAPGGFGQGMTDILNPVPAVKTVATAMFGDPKAQAEAKANLRDATIGATQRQAQLTKEAANAGRYSEAVGHGLATAIPIIGPAAAEAAETIGGVSDMPPSQTMPSEGPPRAPQVARGLGQATALVTPSVASSLARAVRNSSIGAGAAGILEDSSSKNYARVLGATTNQNKNITARIAPELADRGVWAATRKGLRNTAEQQIQSFGQQIGDAFDALHPDTNHPLQPILDSIDSAAKNSFQIPTSRGLMPKGPTAETGLSHIQDLKKALTNVSEVDPSTGEAVIPVDRLRAMRQYFDGIAAKAGRYGGIDLANESLAEAHGMAADAIREELAGAYPDIAKINKEYSFWKSVHGVVDSTIKRTQSQATPLGEQLATAAGAAAKIGAHGTIGGAALTATGAKLLVKFVRSPAWQTTSAITKSRLADLLAAGNSDGVAELIGRATGSPWTYRLPETTVMAGTPQNRQTTSRGTPVTMPPPE